jgi:hypothetical protein
MTTIVHAYCDKQANNHPIASMARSKITKPHNNSLICTGGVSWTTIVHAYCDKQANNQPPTQLLPAWKSLKHTKLTNLHRRRFMDYNSARVLQQASKQPTTQLPAWLD